MIYFQLCFCNIIKTTPPYSKNQAMDMTASWRTYISATCEKLILEVYQQYSLTSFAQYLHGLFQNRDLIQCKMYDKLSKEFFYTIRKVCSFINIYTWDPLIAIHRIQVHPSQMINFTIIKAYVPYSDDCRPHAIGLYEATNGTILETFCGVVQMESVYTKYYMLHFSVMLGPYHPHTSAHLYASHQVHMQNAVISRRDTEVLLPGSFNITIGPTSVLLVGTGCIEFLWYLSNTIYYPQKSEGARKAPILQKLQIGLHSLVCSSDSVSTLSSYHGLLNRYMQNWRVFPYKQFKCNITHVKSWITNYHLYTTIVIYSLKIPLHLHLVFSHYCNDASYRFLENILPERTSLSAKSLSSHKALRYWTLYSNTTSILFDRFSYIGTLSTTKQRYVKDTLMSGVARHLPLGYVNLYIPLGK